jgi:beta-lactamase regulating signal transducer with metallopeptidase domain/Leucine-rich repeat (LRR) protein
MNAFWEIVASNAVLVVVLATAVAVVGRFWKNPQGLYILWLLVLLKFVTPPLFTVGFHLPRKPVAVVPDNPATVSASEETTAKDFDRSRLDPVSEQTITHPGSSVDAPQVTTHTEIPWLIVLAGLWCVGIAGIAIWQAFRILRFGRLLRAAQPPPPDVLHIAAEAGEHLGLRRIPAIRMLPVRVSPMIWTICLKPQVLLPVELFERLEPAAQSSLLAHQLAHVRRKDHLVRLLQLLISTLFWWHPVAWWACRELQQLEELCCDAMVVGLAPSSRKAYAIALMDTLDFLCDGFVAPPLGATATKSSVLLARRIAMMKNGAGVVPFTFGRLVLLVLTAAIPMSIAIAAKSQGDESKAATAAARNPDDAASTVGRTAKPNDEEAKVIAEIKELGGTVIFDENKPDRPVISVDFERAPMGKKITDAVLASLEGLTQLRTLNLASPFNAEYTESGLKHLASLTKLQSLSLQGKKITDAGVKHLKGLSQLKSLRLMGCRITDAGLANLEGFSQLESLDLGGNFEVSDAGLIHLKSLPKLRRLDLWATRVTRSKLVCLKELTQVEAFSLEVSSDADLEHVKDLTKLEGLLLRGGQITDAGLECLDGLTGLQRLDFDSTFAVTDAGLKHLEGLKQLRVLFLVGNTLVGGRPEPVTDAGLEHLRPLTNLQQLTLRGNHFTDAGLKNLKGVQIPVLMLTETRITDAGLAYLKDIPNLQKLYVFQAGVTDDGVQYLKELVDLKLLDLVGTKVTDEGLKALQQALPQCRIYAGIGQRLYR